MRPISREHLIDERGLALLTAREITNDGPLYLADFRDTHALIFKGTGHFIGLSITRGIRFGGYPLQMIDGIWYITEDTEAQHGHEDMNVSVDMLAMGLIK